MSTLSIAAVQYDIQWLDQQTNFKHLEELLSDYFIPIAELTYYSYRKHFQPVFVLIGKMYKSLRMVVPP